MKKLTYIGGERKSEVAEALIEAVARYYESTKYPQYEEFFAILGYEMNKEVEKND